MGKYRVGIIGFGWVAEAHLEAFKKIDQFEPYAILSGRQLDTVVLKEKYGVNVKIYNDIDKFLADKEIDVVDICTPSFLHYEQTIAASNAGKHIPCCIPSKEIGPALRK